MNGVIVFRPVEAWFDSQDPLLRVIPGVTLKDVPIAQAVRVVLAAFGRVESAPPLDEKKRVSIELPPSTVLDLLNATVRSHGELSWGWDDINPAHIPLQGPVDYRHTISFSFFYGSRTGFDVH
jgi:hypothetical protein